MNNCERCDDTGCPVCDPEWAQNQVPAPPAAQPAPDAAQGDVLRESLASMLEDEPDKYGDQSQLHCEAAAMLRADAERIAELEHGRQRIFSAEQEQIERPLREKLAAMTECYETEVQRLTSIFKAAEEADCLPGCDSWGHEDACPFVNMTQHFANVAADNAKLREVVAAVVVKDGRIHCNDVNGANWFDAAQAKLERT